MRKAALAIVVALCAPGTALAQSIQEYPAGGQSPLYITTGHDGRLWYALSGSSAIGRMDAQGEAQPTIASNLGPSDILTGPGGSMVWTTDLGLTQRNANGVLTSVATSDVFAVAALPSGQIVHGKWESVRGDGWVWLQTCVAQFDQSRLPCGLEISVAASPDHSVGISDVSVGPDGKAWIVASEANLIRRASGGVDIFDLTLDLNPGSFPHRITPGPDGAMWFTEYGSNRIGRVTTAGALTEFPLPRPGVGPWDIVAGPDGALWFTETTDAGNAIGRVTTAGQVTEYPLPSAAAGAYGITVGPDGKLWFTESFADKVGRLDPALATPLGGGGPGGAGPGPGPARDNIKPSFQGRVTISRNRFKRGGSATLRFRLSEPAELTLAFEQAAKGHRSHGRCRAAGRKGPACKLWRSTGPELTRQGTTGVNSITFNGRFGRKPLAVGSYRAKLRAVDAAGNRSKTVALPFKVVPK